MSEKRKNEILKELTDVLREGHSCPLDRLPSETQARAAELQSKAISLVEELTGEEWRFEFWTI